jgi:hypothetical protein
MIITSQTHKSQLIMGVTLYNKQRYRIGFDGEDTINLYSIDKNKYPNILGLSKNDLTIAYETRTWVRIRGCEALYNGIVDGYVLLDVRPSNDVEILEAKMVERDVYHARLPVSEIESMWEERIPFLDFPYPDGLPTREELEIPKS